MYPKALGLTYIDTLLNATSTQFSDSFGEEILRKDSIPRLQHWDVQFEALLRTIEDQNSVRTPFIGLVKVALRRLSNWTLFHPSASTRF